MRYREILISLMSVMSLFLFTAFSCNKNEPPPPPDPCKDIICKNDGVCEEGTCNCLPGFQGEHCEQRWQEKYEGVWAAQDSSDGRFTTFTVTIRPSLTLHTAIVMDSFWTYKANNILVHLTNENTLVFEDEQNVYPGYHENYILKKGDAKVNDQGRITGMFIISRPGEDDQPHFFVMKKL